MDRAAPGLEVALELGPLGCGSGWPARARPSADSATARARWTCLRTSFRSPSAWAASLHTRRATIKANRANSSIPQPEVQIYRGWWTVAMACLQGFLHPRDRSRYPLRRPCDIDPARCEQRTARASDASSRASSRAIARAHRGVAKALGAHRHERCAHVEQLAGVRRALHAAHADHRDLHARRRRPPPGRARPARTAGPDSPPVPPARASGVAALRRGAPRARRERHRAQRVDQRDRVRAAVLGRPRAQRPRRRVLGVSLTISGLRVRGRTVRDDVLQLARDRRRCRGPSATFGQDTLSSTAAISSRASQASTQLGELRRRSSPSRS